MDTKTDILNELRLISPVIAAIEKTNVFTVPPGYFDSISVTVMACLREGRSVEAVENEQPGEIPPGYFDRLAVAVLAKIKSQETAEEEIRDLSAILYSIRDKNVFETPSGYFESVPEMIFGKITGITPAKKELKELSPLLSAIQNKEAFEVPPGYFENLSDNIIKIIRPRAARVIKMHARNLLTKYAVAAMITVVAGLGIYKYSGNPKTGAAVALDASIEKGRSMNDIQFNEALSNLKEADIAKYLENNGDVTDVAVLNNNLEEVNLPSQDDYLLDETTLDKYLKEIESPTSNN